MFRSLKKLFRGGEKGERIIAAPISGAAIPMGQVSNPTFSQGILGERIAVIPSNGRVVTPADGLVTMIFDTEHAISMWTDNGAGLITRIGLGTIQLRGQHFKAHVATGDKVKQGNLLLDLEMDRIKGAGYDVTTPVIICSMLQFPKMEYRDEMEVKARETVITKL